MRKKFTLLIAALLTFVGVAKADFTQQWTSAPSPWTDEVVTDYPEELDWSTGTNGVGQAVTTHGTDGHTVRKAETLVVVSEETNVEISFQWSGGAHSLWVLGVDLLDGDNQVVKSDYALKQTGGNKNVITYTLALVPAGTYTLRYFICDKGSDHEVTLTNGTITVEGKINTIVTSAADLSNDKVYTVSTYKRGSWIYSSEKNALTSTTNAGVAVNASDSKQQFAFLTVDGKVYLYSVGAAKFVVKAGEYTGLVDYPEAHVTLEATDNTNYPVVVALNGANHMAISNGYDPAVITKYNDLNDEGNQSRIVAVEGTFDLADALAKINMNLAAERNALLAVVKSANAAYDEVEDKTHEAVVALKTQMDAAVVAAHATDATTATLDAARKNLNAALTGYFLREYDLTTQMFNLKNASTGLYMTIVATESGNQDAGGVQIKNWEEKNTKQMFQLVAVDGGYKIKSAEGYYLANFASWGYKATAADGALHEVAYVGEGKYTLKSATGYVGSNNGATSDGACMYSNHDAGKNNIYWTLEPVVNYTLTDVLGNVYTGIYRGVAGKDMPVLPGAAGCTFSDVVWNGSAITAKVTFPFPISNAATTNATMISNFNEGQRWHAVGDDVKVQTAHPTYATKGEWLWAIYPKFENGAFTFTVKNVGNGKFVTVNKEENSFDAQGTVTLTETGTALEVISWLNYPCFNVPGKTLYLTINGSGDSDVYLATYTGGNGNHGGNKLHFAEFVDVATVTLNKTAVTLNPKENTVQLSANVAPENAMDKAITWNSSAEAVAVVDANGLVTAVADGEATISATAGGVTAECVVTVDVARYATVKDKEDFSTKVLAFAELGKDKALEVLKAIKAMWETTNASVEALSAKVVADELVLKSEVKAVTESMETVKGKIEPVLKYYTETYMPALVDPSAFLSRLAEGAEGYKDLSEAITDFEEVSEVVTVAELETKESELAAVYASVVVLYDLTEVKDAFAEQFDVFSALGENEAMGYLTAISAQWAAVNTVADSLSNAIGDNKLVLKAEVTATKESMTTTMAAIAPVLMYYNETYKSALDAPSAFLSRLAEGAEGYATLSDAITAFETVSDVEKVTELKDKVSALKGVYDSVVALYDLDEVQESFTTQAREFAALKNDSAMAALAAISAQWTAVNTVADSLSKAIAGNKLVLKSEVKAVTESMETVKGKIEPVLKYYTETYMPALVDPSAFLSRLAEGAEGYKDLSEAITDFEEVSEVVTVAELETKESELAAVYASVVVLYDLTEVKDAFAEQFDVFSALGENEAMGYLTAISAQWAAVNTVADSLSNAIGDNKLVLKAEVTATKESMTTTMAAIAPVLMYYNETYKSALDAPSAFLSRLAEGAEGYATLSDAITAFETVSDVEKVTELKDKVSALTKVYDEVVALYDLKEVKDEFAELATAFAALGENEAMADLIAIYARWEAVNAMADSLSKAISENELVLKSEIEELMGALDTVTIPIAVNYYVDYYKPDVDTLEAELAYFVEGTDVYKMIEEALDTAQVLSSVNKVDDLEVKHVDLYNAIVDAFALVPDTVILNKVEAEMTNIGDTIHLTALVEAESEFADKTVFWTSDNETVATVKDGVIEAKGYGTANITVYTVYKRICAVCVVTVSDTTGAISVVVDGESLIYDLNGRRVEKAVKGIYIINGRKVVIK